MTKKLWFNSQQRHETSSTKAPQTSSGPTHNPIPLFSGCQVFFQWGKAPVAWSWPLGSTYSYSSTSSYKWMRLFIQSHIPMCLSGLNAGWCEPHWQVPLYWTAHGGFLLKALQSLIHEVSKLDHNLGKLPTGTLTLQQNKTLGGHLRFSTHITYSTTQR